MGNTPVMLPITVNDVVQELPAIQANADYYGDKAEFFFLDDEAIRSRCSTASAAIGSTS